MFPDDPMASAYEPFIEPIPLNTVDPDALPTVCVQISTEYIPALLGALYTLLNQKTWATTDAAALDLQQSRIWQLIYLFQSAGACPSVECPQGTEVHLDMSDLIQVAEVNGVCVLQYRCCIADPWVTVARASDVGNPGQPGGGATQPEPGGGQACYHAVMAAGSKWNIPVALNTGDKISIQNLSGAVSNSHNGNWRCGNGNQFFGGQCLPFPQTFSTDPMPGEYSGSLVVNINGTFYSLNHGDFTLPSGIVAQQALIQVNDAAIAGLSGQYTFDVCITNNQAGEWTHSWDFRSSPGNFTPTVAGFAQWFPGIGWMETQAQGNYTNVQIDSPVFTSTTVKTAQFYVIDPSPCSGAGYAAVGQPGGPWVLNIGSLPCGASVQVLNGSNAQPLTRLHLQLTDGGNLGGVIQQLILTGIGVDPFQ